MTYSLPRPAVYAFFFTALLYLVSVSYISYPLTTFLKPMPLICLMIGVLQSDVIRWAKVLVILALGFSILGDIVLTIPMSLQLELGIGSFLLAHCCFIILFLNRFKFKSLHLLYFLPLFIYGGFVLSLIIPHLGGLFIPVIVYFCILLSMVFSAFQVRSQALLIGAGAISFLFSDSILAYNLFVLPKADMTLIIMFDYYLAQLLLALGLVAMYQRAR